MKSKTIIVVSVIMGVLVADQRAWTQSTTTDSCIEQIRNARRSGEPSAVAPTCLRLGPLVVGMSRAEVEHVMGPADTEVTGPASCSNAVYMWPRDFKERLSTKPVRGLKEVSFGMIRLIYREDRVIFVEAWGDDVKKEFNFGPIRIGATASSVRKLLGSPLHPGTPWSYGQFFVMFDDDLTQVTSIAVGVDEKAAEYLLPGTFVLSCDAAGAVRGIKAISPPPDEIRRHSLEWWPGQEVWAPPGCN